jgi:hypothetical protein
MILLSSTSLARKIAGRRSHISHDHERQMCWGSPRGFSESFISASKVIRGGLVGSFGLQASRRRWWWCKAALHTVKVPKELAAGKLPRRCTYVKGVVRRLSLHVVGHLECCSGAITELVVEPQVCAKENKKFWQESVKRQSLRAHGGGGACIFLILSSIPRVLLSKVPNNSANSAVGP